jgi:hypothetical protein
MPLTIAQIPIVIGISIADANGFQRIIIPSRISTIPSTNLQPQPWVPERDMAYETTAIPEIRIITPINIPVKIRAAPGAAI